MLGERGGSRSAVRRPRGPRRALVALGVSVALLAACSGQAPGTAATVDGQRISESEVTAVATELSPYLAQPLTPGQALTSIIQAREIVDVASENGFGVSEDDALRTLGAIGEQLEQAPSTEDLDAQTILVARSLVVLQGLAQAPDGAALQQEITDRFAAVDVTVSPRYGTWDAGAITPSAFEWLEAGTAETTPDVG